MPIESRRFIAAQNSLAEILSWTYAQLSCSALISGEKSRVELALEEAIVNILSHAKGDAPLSLEVTVRHLPSRQLEIELKDNGVYFNPLIHPIDDQRELPLQDRQPGGVGVLLIKKCMDAVTYRFEEGCNILTLTKNLEQLP